MESFFLSETCKYLYLVSVFCGVYVHYLPPSPPSLSFPLSPSPFLLPPSSLPPPSLPPSPPSSLSLSPSLLLPLPPPPPPSLPPQLFDTDNVLNKQSLDYIFTTEGHVIRVDPAYRVKPWEQRQPSGSRSAREGDEVVGGALLSSDNPFVGHSVSCCKLPVDTLMAVQ